MLFRRLVVWNSTILVFLTAVFVWYNLTSTQKIVEEEVYNSFYTSMDTGAAELASVFRDARNLTLELCANTSVQRALRQDDAAWQDEEQKIQAARQSSENLTRFFPTFNAEIYGLDAEHQLFGADNIKNISEEWLQAVLHAQGQFVWDAPYGSNTAALKNAYSSAASRLSNLQDTINQQQQNLQDYQQAQEIVQRYAGVLGIAENAASVQTGQALRSIQSALLQTDVDTDAIEQQARAVFEQLQAAQDSGADADFQTLLNDMDSFIRKVQDYAVLKASGDALKNQINRMAADTAQDTENWEPLWTEKLELLKATISGLPVSDSGQAYDRADALDQLDDAQRLHISEYNSVDQALIYLGSPYCQLAIFSLVLTFFLDIAAFITGLVIDVADRRKMSER